MHYIGLNMVDKALAELKKLGPKARLKKLKQIKLENKDAADKIEDLIKTSEKELPKSAPGWPLP